MFGNFNGTICNMKQANIVPSLVLLSKVNIFCLAALLLSHFVTNPMMYIRLIYCQADK